MKAPRRIDVLTLGLSAQSRLNPLYRWWARRNVEENMAVALKALQLRLGHDEIVISAREIRTAAATAATLGPDGDGGLRLLLIDDAPPKGLRILWGRTRA